MGHRLGHTVGGVDLAAEDNPGIGHDEPEDPDPQCRVWRSGAISVGMVNGIKEKWVMLWRWTVSQNRLEDHFGTSTAVAPMPRTGRTDQVCALT